MTPASPSGCRSTAPVPRETKRHPSSLFHIPDHHTRLVSWCFKPSQPKRIIPGLEETFMKRHILERTNKAEIRLKEQSEKAESCQANLWMKYSWKGQHDRNRRKNRIKKERASSVGLCQKHELQHPHHMKGSPRGWSSQRNWLHATCEQGWTRYSKTGNKC